jgi:hypothetical protein
MRGLSIASRGFRLSLVRRTGESSDELEHPLPRSFRLPDSSQSGSGLASHPEIDDDG